MRQRQTEYDEELAHAGLDPAGIPTHAIGDPEPRIEPRLTLNQVKDNVNLPDHYAKFKFEPIRFIVTNQLTYFKANLVKYALRVGLKEDHPGHALEDIRKMHRILDMMQAFHIGKDNCWHDDEQDPDWWKQGRITR